ncbi:alpha/beta-tubulin-N-acetyltransferase 9 isoform X6 [Kogia breviceps]
MKSEELRRLTASEPLTLEQEYVMQHSWQEDADKCTFIVLDAEKWQAQPGTSEESCMVGDVNLFLTDLGDPSLGEIEVMIAEPSCRGQGLGTEAVLMMMSYAPPPKPARAPRGFTFPHSSKDQRGSPVPVPPPRQEEPSIVGLAELPASVLPMQPLGLTRLLGRRPRRGLLEGGDTGSIFAWRGEHP